MLSLSLVNATGKMYRQRTHFQSPSVNLFRYETGVRVRAEKHEGTGR